MIHLMRPEAFLLGLLVVLVLRKRLLAGPFVTTLRVVLLLLVVAVLADPWIVGRSTGRDLVLVVDRSRSMPASGLRRAAEIHEIALESAHRGDRIGVVTFGRDAVVERAPQENAPWAAPSRTVDADATDLAGAIDAALALVPPDRPASLLVISDGESTGRDPASAARYALRRGVRIDAVPVRRPGALDLAVEEIAVPAEVAEGEPFPVTIWVRSDRDLEAPVTVHRDGKEIASGTRQLRRGLNAIRLRDRLQVAGVHRYDVVVAGAEDRVPENDRARTALRVTGPFRVLLVTPHGREDRLTRSLRAAGLAVVVSAPEDAPTTPSMLDAFRAVVLENVALQDLPPGTDANLSAWVRELGGGLLLTGGRASFGLGGYYRSSIERVLPVTMEVRQEQRRFHLAMSIALDRSGSMMAPAGSGSTKMDLANLGTCAAIELLGPQDAVAVIAVDSAPHVVVPLVSAGDRDEICAHVRQIESMGGGIFVNTALKAAAAQLRGASQGTRHIVLFADAADAEEPGDYETFVPALKAAGVTVSVIGLGSDSDSDADFLRDVAHRGGGRCFFAADPLDLPRVFAQETIQVARSSFADEATAVRVEPGLLAVGALGGQTFPDVGGYSVAWLEPDAQRGLVTLDDTGAPLFSFWQHGLGRSAAYLGVADGKFSGAVGDWDGYGHFFATVVRWLAGTEATGDVYAEVERRGHEAVLTVEVERGDEAFLAGLDARVLLPSGEAEGLTLVRVDETRLEGRFPLQGEGIHRPVLRLADDRVLRMPPVSLPYSPEFEPRADPAYGEETLRRVVRIAGGRIDPPAGALWEGPRSSRGATSLVPWLVLASVVLLLLEIAVRRLRPTVPFAAATSTVGRAWRRLPRPRWARRWPKPRAEPDVEPGEEPEGDVQPKAASKGDETANKGKTGKRGKTDKKDKIDDIASVLERARRRHRNR